MPATQTKRLKEQQRLEHRKNKDAERAARKLEKANRPPRQPGDSDPDIAHIVPGPQPLPENP
jgi:hypothetical protein